MPGRGSDVEALEITSLNSSILHVIRLRCNEKSLVHALGVRFGRRKLNADYWLLHNEHRVVGF